MNFKRFVTTVTAVLLSLSVLEVKASDVASSKSVTHAQSHQNQQVQMYLNQAYNGNDTARIKIGHMYLSGEDLEKDEVKAAQWFEVAALNGNPEAQIQIAFMYASGTGVTKNRPQAVVWLGKAANQNHAQALDLLHWMSQAAH